MSSRSRKITLIVFAVIAILAYIKFEKPWDPTVKIGPFRIRESQIQYQMAVNRIAIPQSTSREFAINQLKETLVYERIMAKYGFPILDAYIPAERIRIETNTQRPELLKAIKNLHEFESRYFDEVFVRGTLVKRLIFNQFYFENAALHQETRKKAQAFLESFKSASEATIRTEAHARGYEFFAYEVNPKVGIKLSHFPASGGTDGANSEDEPLPQSQETPLVEANEDTVQNLKNWFSTHAELESRDATLIDEGEQWAIFIRKSHRPSALSATGVRVVVQKRPFQEWIKSESEAALRDDYLNL